MEIINDILDISKIEAGKLEIERAVIDLDRMITHVTDMFEDEMSKKKIAFKVNMDDDLPRRVLGDELRLRQVLINLLGNAVKFTPSGHIHLDVKRERTGKDGICIRFTLEDTGVGIPKEMLPKLFEPFTQAEGSTTREYGGTGLGLAICKRLVSLMGGDIYVDKDIEIGSRFVFTVLFGRIDQKEDFDFSSGDGQPGTFAGKLRGSRVLLVEDNETNRFVTSEILHQAGVVVDTASNGKAAIECLGKNDYAAILMDLQLPEMDGHETTRRIRGDSAKPVIPIIAMTAFTSEPERKKCMESGMDDFIPKPVDPDQLFDVLERWIVTKEDGKQENAGRLKLKVEKAIDSGDIPPVLDIDSGIHRMMGSREKYEKLLEIFLQEYSDAQDKLKAMVGQKDKTAAVKFVHGAKGVAGTISALELQCAAEDLESRLASEKPNVDDSFKRFEASLKRTFVEARRFIDQRCGSNAGNAENEKPELDIHFADIRPYILELKRLLKENNYEADDYIHSIREKLSNTKLDTWMITLTRQIEVFDFAGALETVSLLEKAMEY
jgi:CheY-like chemotaxis protein/HPt (histidine-containing phosphotransfer) domain-containing protein